MWDIVRFPITCCMTITLCIAAGATSRGQLPRMSHYSFEGTNSNDLFGFSVADAGDVDGDGVNDIIIGAVNGDVGVVDYGSATIYSGADAGIIYEFHGDAVTDSFGFAVAGVGDINADGFDDVIIGAPFADESGVFNSGSARVFSGIDGSVLFTFGGDSTLANLGAAVAGAGDVNNDGVPDLIVGAPFGDSPTVMNTGYAKVFSGADGSILHTFFGTMPSDGMGVSVAAAGDPNADGFDDVLVGVPLDDTVALNSGRAFLMSGANGSVLQSFEGSAASENFGTSVAGIGDIDGDSRGDIAVGAPFADSGAVDAGLVRVFSGDGGAVLHTFQGNSVAERFGTSVSGDCDIDGDGTPDIIVGAPFADDGGPDTGSVEIYSGANGSLIDSMSGSNSGSLFGFSVSGIKDLDGKGFDDFIVGAQAADVNALDDGRAMVFVDTIQYVGTNEDVLLLTGIDGAPTTFNVKCMTAGQTLSINYRSPMGTYNFFPPILAAQFFTTGNPTPSAFGFPELHLDPTGITVPFAIYDGTSNPFGPAILPPSGLSFTFVLNPGLVGLSLIIQGISLAPAFAPNLFFASSEAHEIRIL